MKNHKIEFIFIERQFDYKLPLVGVDVEFLKLRRAEIHECVRLLGEEIGRINIASKQGVSDIDKASKLVKYYFYAGRQVDSKYKQLTEAPVERKTYSEAQAKQISSRFD